MFSSEPSPLATSSQSLPYARVLELLADDQNLQKLEEVTKALGSETRLEILRFLSAHTCTLLEIAEALNLPPSTATLHINVLEKAGLIETDLRPATRGLQKVCARVYDRIVIQLPADPGGKKRWWKSRCRWAPSWISTSRRPAAWWASWGSSVTWTIRAPSMSRSASMPSSSGSGEVIVEYRFPNRLPPNVQLDDVEVSFEVCSEAPLHHPDWPSDVTVWMGDVEVGTWTSPADFGGERGALTPDWWDTQNSQFGLLKVWKVTTNGSYVDGVMVSNRTLRDLSLKPNEPIRVRIGIKDNAAHVGGINLFGDKFGNYPQGIVLRQHFKRLPGPKEAK